MKIRSFAGSSSMPRRAVRIAALDQTRLFVRRRDDMFGWPPGGMQVNPMHQAFMMAAAGFGPNSMQQMGMTSAPFIAQHGSVPGFSAPPVHGPQQGQFQPLQQSGADVQQASGQGANQSSAAHSRSPRRQITDGGTDGGLMRFADDDRKLSTADRCLLQWTAAGC